MNASKNRYSVRFEPGSQDYSIYNGEVVLHRGYDTKREADIDLEKLIDNEAPATRKDFEEFFKTTFGEINKIK